MARSLRPRVAVTVGDPSGIGPEIVAKALRDRAVRSACEPVVVGPRRVFAGRNALPSGVDVVEPPGLAGQHPRQGAPSAAAGRVAFASVRLAATLARDGLVSALATAPISKGSLAAAGLPYRDHTEFLAAFFQAKPSMMLLAGKLRVLHATGHLPVREAAARVTAALAWDKLFLLDRTLRRLGIPRPHLAMAALNPHAGEGGLIGTEDRDILTPVAVAAGRLRHVTGPLAPDIVFRRAARGDYDGVVCFLHDHGHVAVKMVSGNEAVQLSAGLPVVRTSPAHGSAPDIAGKGKADPAGMVAAILLAARLGSRPPVVRAWAPPLPASLIRRPHRG